MMTNDDKGLSELHPSLFLRKASTSSSWSTNGFSGNSISKNARSTEPRALQQWRVQGCVKHLVSFMPSKCNSCKALTITIRASFEEALLCLTKLWFHHVSPFHLTFTVENSGNGSGESWAVQCVASTIAGSKRSSKRTSSSSATSSWEPCAVGTACSSLQQLAAACSSLQQLAVSQQLLRQTWPPTSHLNRHWTSASLLPPCFVSKQSPITRSNSLSICKRRRLKKAGLEPL